MSIENKIEATETKAAKPEGKGHAVQLNGLNDTAMDVRGMFSTTGIEAKGFKDDGKGTERLLDRTDRVRKDIDEQVQAGVKEIFIDLALYPELKPNDIKAIMKLRDELKQKGVNLDLRVKDEQTVELARREGLMTNGTKVTSVERTDAFKQEDPTEISA